MKKIWEDPEITKLADEVEINEDAMTSFIERHKDEFKEIMSK